MKIYYCTEQGEEVAVVKIFGGLCDNLTYEEIRQLVVYLRTYLRLADGITYCEVEKDEK